ncbi:uncharacterized protein [Branchiostoma lanceolatum]|uniref:uncharacterized protein n=1 Tax=Branchiostoma lanceolatum TaxID=7740 RepID=UPI0034545881
MEDDMDVEDAGGRVSDGGGRVSDGGGRVSDGGSESGSDEDSGSSRESGGGGGGGKRIWQLFVVGLGGGTTIIRIHGDATVDELINAISASNNIPPEAQRVLYTTKQLEYGRGKRLSDYNMQDQSTLFVVLRLQGGSNAGLEEDEETSEVPSLISGSDDPDTPRVRMSCGHAITPETLTIYCENLLKDGKYIFQCPHISETTGEHCGKEWPYPEVGDRAALPQEKRKKFEKGIAKNYLRIGMGIQRCPECRSYCERLRCYHRRNERVRVVCRLCSTVFCWCCLQKWVSSDTVVCGNNDCSGEDRRLRYLRNFQRRTIVGVPDCPGVRACPRCGILITHDRACKHMTCICSLKFCFICLKPAVHGEYQCGPFNSPCEVANVQTTIPSDHRETQSS